MLATRLVDITIEPLPVCSAGCARENLAAIEVQGIEGAPSVWLCRDCALRLSRRLLADLCEVITGERDA